MGEQRYCKPKGEGSSPSPRAKRFIYRRLRKMGFPKEDVRDAVIAMRVVGGELLIDMRNSTAMAIGEVRHETP